MSIDVEEESLSMAHASAANDVAVDVPGCAFHPESGGAKMPVIDILRALPDVDGVDRNWLAPILESLLLEIDQERIAQGWLPYDNNWRVILVGECFRTAVKFKDKGKRKDGTNIFETHLVGAARNCVVYSGFTGLGSVLAAINHDTVEDLVDNKAIFDQQYDLVLERVRQLAGFFAKILRKKDFDFAKFSEKLGNIAGAIKSYKADDGKRADYKDYKKVLEKLSGDCISLLSTSLPEDAKSRITAGSDGFDKKLSGVVGEDKHAIDFFKKAFQKSGKLSLKELIEAESEHRATALRRMREREIADDLINHQCYRSMISESNEWVHTNITRISEEVRRRVLGVTKFPHRDPQVSALETRKIHLREATKEPYVIQVKAGDRLQNLESLDGHIKAAAAKNKEEEGRKKVRDIALETFYKYIPTWRLFGLKEAVRKGVAYCLQYLNPELGKDFDVLTQKRFKKYLEPCIDFVKKELANMSCVGCVDCKLNTIDMYLPRTRKNLENVKIDDLNISPIDSMGEILVLTNSSDVANSMVEVWDVVNRIEEKFGRTPGASVELEVPRENDYLKYSGIVVNVKSPTLGGRLRFRVNNRYLEARAKRGVAAGFTEATPEEIVKRIQFELKRESAEHGGSNGHENKEALGQVWLETPGGKLVYLPEGSCPLDFARLGVHSEALIGLKAFHLIRKGKDRDEVRTMNLHDPAMFEPISRADCGLIFEVESCLPDSKVEGAESFGEAAKAIELGPFWLKPAFHQDTRRTIREYLRDPLGFAKVVGYSERDLRQAVMKNGTIYLQSLEDILGASHENMTWSIRKSYTGKDSWMVEKGGRRRRQMHRSDKVRFDVGAGEKDPIALYASFLEYLALSKGSESSSKSRAVESDMWHVEVRVPDEVGGMGEMYTLFSTITGLNIHRPRSHRKGHEKHAPTDTTILLIDLDAQDVSLERFFEQLVKFNSKYSARIVRKPPKYEMSERKFRERRGGGRGGR